MKKIIICLIIITSFLMVWAEDYYDVDVTPSLKVTVLINGDANEYTMQSWSAQLYSTNGTLVGTAVVGNTTPGVASNIEGCYFGVNSVDTSVGFITVDIANLGYNYRRYRTTTFDNPVEYVRVVTIGETVPSAPARNEGEYTWGANGNLTDGPTLNITYNIEGRADVTVNPGNTGWAGIYIGIGEENLTFYFDGDDWGEGGMLPVTLTSFTAVLTDGTPQLQWITQSEINNAGWNIYRSETEDQEESIKVNSEFIPGAGTTSQPTDYTYLDEYEVENGTKYYYWLESIAFNGNSENFGPITINVPEEGEENPPPADIIYGLHQNYPNPFNPETDISFALEEAGPVSLAIYNVKGQKVITLIDNEEQDKDITITKHWDGCNQKGMQASSGIYFYRLETKSKTYNRKMVLTK